MENKLKHLELVQNVINRMAHNSFLLKGWSVILLSGLFALAAKEINPMFIYLAYLPTISFWMLDGYYLYQERLYRRLFDEIRIKEPQEIDFDMNASRYKGEEKATWFKGVMSLTMILFHGILVGVVIVAMFVCMGGKGGANG